MKGLGEQIRAERKARKLRLQTIADRAGLTPSFLSQVERSIAAPSLSSLALIAQAIGVEVRALLPAVEAGSGPARRGARVPFGLDPGRITYERLSTTLDEGRLNAVKLRVAPGYKSEASSHEGEEFVYVLSGRIRYVVDGTVHDLAADDALHFSSAHLHHVENVGAETAEYVSVGTFNVFGKAAGTTPPGPAGDRGDTRDRAARPARRRPHSSKGISMMVRLKGAAAGGDRVGRPRGGRRTGPGGAGAHARSVGARRDRSRQGQRLFGHRSGHQPLRHARLPPEGGGGRRAAAGRQLEHRGHGLHVQAPSGRHLPFGQSGDRAGRRLSRSAG